MFLARHHASFKTPSGVACFAFAVSAAMNHEEPYATPNGVRWYLLARSL